MPLISLDAEIKERVLCGWLSLNGTFLHTELMRAQMGGIYSTFLLPFMQDEADVAYLMR